MKRLSTMLAVITLVITALATPTFASNTIILTFNGEILNTNISPTLLKNTTFVPLRVIADALGATTGYTKTSTNEYIEITKNDKVIKLSIKAEQGYPSVNGEPIEFKMLAITTKGTTMVPARFVSEQLGLNVNYVSATNTVAISTKDFVSTTPVVVPNTEVPTGKVIIKLDGKTLSLGAQTVTENGVFYIPATILKELGATMDVLSNQITIKRKDIVFLLFPKNTIGWTKLNWSAFPIKQFEVFKKVDNQTYLPAEFVLKHLNCTTSYNKVTNTYNITNKGLIKVELTTERHNDVKGYVKDMKGNPVADVKLYFIPLTADGSINGDAFNRKFNTTSPTPTTTDENGYYEFKNIDTNVMNFACINTNNWQKLPNKWYGETPVEVDLELLNNTEPSKGFPGLRMNTKRLIMPTIYVLPNDGTH